MNDEIVTVEKNILQKVDDFEEKIILIQNLSKQYDALKKELKKQMIDYGRSINATRVKWETPNGIKISCKIGERPVFEKQMVEEFDMYAFRMEQPEMYQKYLVKKEREVNVKPASFDRLVITSPKMEEQK